MDINVTFIGIDELKRKLDGKFLIQPEIEKVGQSLGTRVNRPRRTAGYLNNPLEIMLPPLTAMEGPLAEFVSPLNRPRRKGTAWRRFVTGLVSGSFMRNQLRSAARRMQERFGS